ncbi:DUF5076 domain-containing protein [Sphingomonas sp.]|uniref:DUF5076 domain-containing protein n=1 Tax=Sphingomonas sp. TaxID=28214 RepID=UPI003CC50C94
MTGPVRRPIAIDLTAHAQLIEDAREFLRLWASEDGPITCFVNPRPLGPDPYLFGVALNEAVTHGARTYASATGIGIEEAEARIRQGFAGEADGDAPPLPADDEFITYTQPGKS